MYVRKFQGDSIEETIKQIKKELGPEAIILKTETLKGIKSAFKKTKVEITAAVTEKNLKKKLNIEKALPDIEREKLYNAPADYLTEMINDYDSTNEQIESRMSGYGNLSLNRSVKIKKEDNSTVLSQLVDSPEKVQSMTSLDDFLGASTNVEKSSTKIEKETITEKRDHFNKFDEVKFKNEIINELKMLRNDNVENESIEKLAKKIIEIENKISKINFVESSKNDEVLRVSRVLKNSGISDDFINREIILKIPNKKDGEKLDVINFAIQQIENFIKIYPVRKNFNIPKTFVYISPAGSGQTSLIKKIHSKNKNGEIFSLSSFEKNQEIISDNLLGIRTTQYSDPAKLFAATRRCIANGKDVHIDLKINEENVNNMFQLLELLKNSVGDYIGMITLSSRFSRSYNSRLIQKFKNYANVINFTYFDQCFEFGSLFNILYENQEMVIGHISNGEIIPNDLVYGDKELLIEKIFNI